MTACRWRTPTPSGDPVGRLAVADQLVTGSGQPMPGTLPGQPPEADRARRGDRSPPGLPHRPRPSNAHRLPVTHRPWRIGPRPRCDRHRVRQPRIRHVGSRRPRRSLLSSHASFLPGTRRPGSRLGGRTLAWPPGRRFSVLHRQTAGPGGSAIPAKSTASTPAGASASRLAGALTGRPPPRTATSGCPAGFCRPSGSAPVRPARAQW